MGLNKKYYGEKIIVTNAQNVIMVKYTYKLNKKNFFYNIIFLIILVCFLYLINEFLEAIKIG